MLNQNYYNQEHFHVYWANSESHTMSTVPYIQWFLNDLVLEQRKTK